MRLPKTDGWCNLRNTFQGLRCAQSREFSKGCVAMRDAEAKELIPEGGQLDAFVSSSRALSRQVIADDRGDDRRQDRGRGALRDEDYERRGERKRAKIWNDNPQGAVLLLGATDAMEMSDSRRRGSMSDRCYCHFPLSACCPDLPRTSPALPRDPLATDKHSSPLNPLSSARSRNVHFIAAELSWIDVKRHLRDLSWRCSMMKSRYLIAHCHLIVTLWIRKCKFANKERERETRYLYISYFFSNARRFECNVIELIIPKKKCVFFCNKIYTKFLPILNARKTYDSKRVIFERISQKGQLY